jgi:hypothetical protein
MAAHIAERHRRDGRVLSFISAQSSAGAEFSAIKVLQRNNM